jgi:hypothetical protein
MSHTLALQKLAMPFGERFHVSTIRWVGFADTLKPEAEPHQTLDLFPLLGI